MKQTIKGKKWRADSPIKGSLNVIRSDKKVYFLEPDTSDQIEFDIQVREQQYALYAEEYLPEQLTQTGRKKADVMVLLLDEMSQQGVWYVLDAKRTVAGADVIFHLCEQWKDTIQYLNHTILAFLEHVTFQEYLGVATECVDYSRIDYEIAARKNKLENFRVIEGNQAVFSKMKAELLKVEKEKSLLEQFRNGKFTYRDQWGEHEYLYKIYLLQEQENKVKSCTIKVQL